GVPTGHILTYFAEIPGDKDGMLVPLRERPSFELLGNFAQSDSAQALIEPKLREMILETPPEQRAQWPSESDYEYVQRCPVCQFIYCPRLPFDAEAHCKKHSAFLMTQ